MVEGLCLLLTATIQVDHPEFLRPGGRLDARLRLQDYCTALEFWITGQRTMRDIVFVENSGYPLDALQAIVDLHQSAGKRVELISCRTAGYSPVRGRSYGELDIMRTALERSALLKNAAGFAKVTGRVCIPNFDAIIRATAPDFDIVGRLSGNLTWLETVLVLFRTGLFAERLLPYALAHVDDQARRPIERVLASACLHGIADGCRWYPFAETARIRGVRGIDNVPYPSGLLRARAIDIFTRGHNRALDNVSSAAAPHPLDQWTARRHPGDDGTR